ncbi:MAG: CCA tRNA nucleotidyltransferase [Fusobacteriaceae bacterium]
MNKFMNLPNEVNFILKKLQKYGQGVLVGGAVRDILLGYTPEDFDFATDLEYSKLIEIFSEFSPKEIGKSFGIIQITVNGKFFEIAKFRKDIEIPDCRKKQEIEFTPDLMEDLKRRDFTINAIAWDGKALIYSEKDSLKHIEERALIFVGDPIKRIKEDPLRVLRMIRFICTKKLTPKYILSLKNENSISLKNLSKERIRDEFNKILMSEEVYLGLTLISFLTLWKYILPEMEKCINFNKNNEHNIFNLIKNSPQDLEIRLSALFHDIEKTSCYKRDETAKNWLKEMRYSNQTLENVLALVKNSMSSLHLQTKKEIKKLIGKIGHENMKKLFKLMEADIISTKPPFDFSDLDKIKILYSEIINQKEAVTVKDLKIDGKDILSLGFESGKKIGIILNYLLELVLENYSLNEKEKLIEIVKKNKDI